MHIVIKKDDQRRKKCSDHKMSSQNFFDIKILYYNVRQNVLIYIMIVKIIIENYAHIIPSFQIDIFVY